MSEQKASCCGPADEAMTEPAKPMGRTNRAPDERVTTRDQVLRDRDTSGLLRAVRRLFGRMPA